MLTLTVSFSGGSWRRSLTYTNCSMMKSTQMERKCILGYDDDVFRPATFGFHGAGTPNNGLQSDVAVSFG